MLSRIATILLLAGYCMNLEAFECPEQPAKIGSDLDVFVEYHSHIFIGKVIRAELKTKSEEYPELYEIEFLVNVVQPMKGDIGDLVELTYEYYHWTEIPGGGISVGSNYLFHLVDGKLNLDACNYLSLVEPIFSEEHFSKEYTFTEGELRYNSVRQISEIWDILRNSAP